MNDGALPTAVGIMLGTGLTILFIYVWEWWCSR